MKHVDYDEVYEVIKDHGPLTVHEISAVIGEKHNILPYTTILGRKCYAHDCSIQGYVSCLFKNGFIQHLPVGKSRLKKTSHQLKRWVIR